jgi:arylsulfatase A-like enzyme
VSPRPEPFFLSLHYTAPHWPWSAPSVEAAARQRELERTELTEGENTRIYGEMMQSLDAGIGRMLDAVRQGPDDDKTLVVFASDNGLTTRSTVRFVPGTDRPCGRIRTHALLAHAPSLSAGVRRGRWKYRKVAHNEYLFDIEYDPRERGDLLKKTA